MSYVVLARKWRPMTFSDLVGQGHVAATLGNAIKSGRIAHAFLFTGVRGVGKTTSARILAKALNCLSSNGPSAEPCLTCAACKEITDGVDMDVQEIDGASYNGVDEVRRLQESLPYRPNRDRYKIIIVDEVHMLSTSAWNAFLKTLEEPPPHVKFIFATTEVHKVPVTILSRVQRFDFKLIPTRLILERLKFVLAAEKIEAEEAALAILAREAAGSMRDAMSLLDQVIAWSDQKLSEADVTMVLGVASRKVLYDLAEAVMLGRTDAPLAIIAELANQGFDLNHVARDLLLVFRDVVVTACTQGAQQLVDLPDDERASVSRLSQHPLDDLLRLHQGFSQSYDGIVRSGQPRAALEMTLVRLARRPPLIPVDDLVERLMRLEKRLHAAGRAGGTPASPPRSAPSTPGRNAPPRGVQGQAARPSVAPSAPVVSPSAPAVSSSAPIPPKRPVASSANSPEVPRERVLAAPAEVAEAPTPAPPAEAFDSSITNAVAPVTSEVARQSIAEDAAPESPPEPVTREAVAREDLTSRTAASEAAASEAVAREAISSAPASSPDPLLVGWRQIVDRVRAADPKLAAFLEHAEVLELGAARIHLRYERSSIVDVAMADAEHRDQVSAAAASVLGAEPELVLERANERPSGQTVFSVDKEQRELQHQAELDAARNHRMVQEAIRVFGARVKNIELPKS